MKSEITERILKYPGFLYELGGNYYYLGKWICKECTNVDASDCVFMYRMSRNAGEDNETNLYFQKIRAYADFALEVPYNPAKIKEEMDALLRNLSKLNQMLCESRRITSKKITGNIAESSKNFDNKKSYKHQLLLLFQEPVLYLIHTSSISPHIFLHLPQKPKIFV